jgi:hypothetical protein
MERSVLLVLGRAMLMEEGSRLMAAKRLSFDLVLDQPRGSD